MAQYKVGDLVKVDMSKRSSSGWRDDVRENKVYKVSGTTDKIPGTFSYFLEGLPFLFNASWLMPAFKLEIGENVKVDDAIGHIIHREISCGKTVYIIELLVKEETEPEPKKRKPLEVFAKMNEYFDWFWDVDKFDLVVGIREGTTTGEESSQPHKRKEFGLDETKQAYKWLVKQALKLDEEIGSDFTEWYNGQD